MMQRRFTIFVIGAPLLFFGLLIIFGRSRPVAFLRIQAARIAAPYTHAAGRAGGWVGLGLEGLSAERIRGLEEDAQHLAAVEAQSRALEKENETLARALGLRTGFGASLKSGRVLQYHAVLGREALVIDLGSDAGAAEGDIVIDSEGLLIGVITEAAAGFSKVAVASNPGVTFSGALVPLGGKVLAKGIGARTLALELIPSDVPVRSGDFVIWTRDDQRGNPAVFAGRVAGSAPAGSGTFKTGRAALLSDPERVEHVMVITR